MPVSFPDSKPSSRSFVPGDFPIKRFVSQSGVETRVLYGSKETGAKLSLSYKNLADTSADWFIRHYRDMKGTYTTFDLSSNTWDDIVRAGWTGIQDRIDAPSGTYWRYARQPQVTSVKPGISNVKGDLVAVL